jgi:alginate O-acetyltransferase complex protein AlgI
MLSNSWEFVFFFVIVYALYLFLDHRWQNRLLLAGSYVFYGVWDWRFLFLLWSVTILTYWCGYKISGSGCRAGKGFLWLCVLLNLSVLGFFKYCDFFIENFARLLTAFGLVPSIHTLSIILPIGISFFTFKAVSYAVDVYRGDFTPAGGFLDFALYIAFFPELLAGPIDRAGRLLSQIASPRVFNFDRFVEGCFLIFWGLYLKVFIADNLALVVNPVFEGPAYVGSSVMVGVYGFTFQILGDFAGYSYMAVGLGRVMGFDLINNFRQPYFSTNPREFWQRWHISLSTWLRDYLYIPLGGNRKGRLMTYRNLGLTMLLGGLWHGANWTFVVWGAYHGLLLMIHRFLEPFLSRLKEPESAFMRRIWYWMRVAVFFQLISLGWLFFRAGSVGQAFQMIGALFSPSTLYFDGTVIVFFVALFVVVEYIQYRKDDLFAAMKWHPTIQIAVYLVILFSLLLVGVKGEEFIYQQF